MPSIITTPAGSLLLATLLLATCPATTTATHSTQQRGPRADPQRSSSPISPGPPATWESRGAGDGSAGAVPWQAEDAGDDGGDGTVDDDGSVGGRGGAAGERDGTTDGRNGTADESGGNANKDGGNFDKSDGRANRSLGGASESDGTAKERDGRANERDGRANKSDGSANTSDGTVNKSDSTTNESDGRANKSGDRANESDGTGNKSDGTANKSDGTANKSDRTANKSDRTANKNAGAANKNYGTANKLGGGPNKSNGAASKHGGTVNKTDGSDNKSESTANKSSGTANKGNDTSYKKGNTVDGINITVFSSAAKVKDGGGNSNATSLTAPSWQVADKGGGSPNVTRDTLPRTADDHVKSDGVNTGYGSASLMEKAGKGDSAKKTNTATDAHATISTKLIKDKSRDPDGKANPRKTTKKGSSADEANAISNAHGDSSTKKTKTARDDTRTDAEDLRITSPRITATNRSSHEGTSSSTERATALQAGKRGRGKTASRNADSRKSRTAGRTESSKQQLRSGDTDASYAADLARPKGAPSDFSKSSATWHLYGDDDGKELQNDDVDNVHDYRHLLLGEGEGKGGERWSARNDLGDQKASNNTKTGESDPGAVLYIIVVLVFYSTGVMVMIIRYLRTEKKELEEEVTLENFFRTMPDKRTEKENRVNRTAIHAFHTLTSISYDDDDLDSAHLASDSEADHGYSDLEPAAAAASRPLLRANDL